MLGGPGTGSLLVDEVCVKPSHVGSQSSDAWASNWASFACALMRGAGMEILTGGLRMWRWGLEAGAAQKLQRQQTAQTGQERIVGASNAGCFLQHQGFE